MPSRQRLSPIARELNSESYRPHDFDRFPKAIAADAFTSADPVKQYKAGRTCDVPGCDTRLSVYNPNNTCAEHPSVKMLMRTLDTPKVVRKTTNNVRKRKSH